MHTPAIALLNWWACDFCQHARKAGGCDFDAADIAANLSLSRDGEHVNCGLYLAGVPSQTQEATPDAQA